MDTTTEFKNYRDIECHYGSKGWSQFAITDLLICFVGSKSGLLAEFAEYMEVEQHHKEERDRKLDNCELDWQLYKSTDGSTKANEALCVALRQAFVVSGATPSSVRKAMDSIMNKYREFGATDSEPYGVLEMAIKRRFRVGDR